MNGSDYEGEATQSLGTLQRRDTPGALESMNRAEIDIQISTAKAYPRSVKAFQEMALTMATVDEETAGSMFYVLKRSGKSIEGPSARLAEIVGSSWGNLRYDAGIVDIDRQFVTAFGACFDLERNVAVRTQVKRRITDKNGNRYSEDMISVTANAAMSIALRNAVFKVVPFSLVRRVYEAAKLTAIGKAESLASMRTKAMAWFQNLGVTDERILAALGRASIDDVTTDDVIELRGMATALKDGESTVEQLFPEIHAEGGNGSASTLKDRLDQKRGQAPEGGERVRKRQEQPKPTEQAPEFTEALTAKVRDLMDRCAQAGLIDDVEATAIEQAIQAEDGAEVSQAIADLQKRLAKATAA